MGYSHLDEKQPAICLKLDIGHDFLKSSLEGARKDKVIFSRQRFVNPKSVAIVPNYHMESRAGEF